jgi:hypothetical protein
MLAFFADPLHQLTLLVLEIGKPRLPTTQPRSKDSTQLVV